MGRWAALGLAFLLLVVGLWLQFGDPLAGLQGLLKPVGDTPALVDGIKEGSSLVPSPIPFSSTIDIGALQKPPYDAYLVNFSLLLPSDIESPELWRSRLERTADKQLISVGLQSTRTTSAGWLVVLEFSDLEIKNGVCEISAAFELYHRGKLIGRQEHFRERGRQGGTLVCEAAVQKIAELVSKKVVSAYFSNQSTE
jgi:hypothetical protein